MTDTDVDTKFPFEASGMKLSQLQVCESANGYYIGRTSWDDEFGFEEPGTRESEYFNTKKDAEDALETGDWYVRQCSENEYLYLQNEALRPVTHPLG